MRNSKCVLLVNLGSPEKPDTKSIRHYLRRFLSDARVMDIPRIVRWLILNLIILPFRPAAILPKYQKIWDGDRFLLVKHSNDLCSELSDQLGPAYSVRIAMRYSQPTIEDVLTEIRTAGVSELIVVPLFPQYASATSGSIIEAVMLSMKEWTVFPQLRILSRFFEHPGFISAWSGIGAPYLEQNPDHVLFSFHGLPETHIQKADLSNHCLSSDSCCDRLGDTNHNCYRAQCFQTARKIAESLSILPEQYSVSFQSRLGKAVWIGPSTDSTIYNLAASGVRNLLVFCPAFTADCLETVEEIGEEARRKFLEGGGRDLTLVPSLNSDPGWIEALADIVKGAD